MKCCSRLCVLVGSLLLVILGNSNSVYGIDLWYNFEGDSGDVARDKLLGDGAHDGILRGNVSIQGPPAASPFGDESALFEPPDLAPATPPFSTLEIPGTTLGADYSLTVALHANNSQTDFTRLVSSFGGTGAVGNRVLLDYDPSGSVIPGIRAIIGNQVFGTASVPAGMADPGYHHYALTVDGTTSEVKVYFDGAEVVSGTHNTGGFTNDFNLFVGEDPHDLGGAANEQLIGNVDDVLVLDQVLSSVAIANLASGTSVQNSGITPTGSLAVNYDFESDSGQTAIDKFAADGQQDGIFTAMSGIDSNPANAFEGMQSAMFDDPAASFDPDDKFSVIDTTVTGTDLGNQFTMSATLNVPPDGGFTGEGLARLFSTFAGSGGVGGRLLLDFNPDADVADIGIRLILPDGTSVVSQDPFTADEDHTITAVYDKGDVKLYLDGVEVASGMSPAGDAPVDLGGEFLRIGEDLAGAVNENFVGTMDHVVILSEALSAAGVQTLVRGGIPEPSAFALTSLLIALLGASTSRRERCS